MKFIDALKKQIRDLNSRRLETRRKNIARTQAISRSKISRPKSIKNIFVIDALKGLGDCIFVQDLITKFIHEHQAKVTVASLPHTHPIYKQRCDLVDLIDLENPDIRETDYDIVIDLTYVGISFWKERRVLLQKLKHNFLVTCAPYFKETSTYDLFIDISNESHELLRLRKVLSEIYDTNLDDQAIMPCPLSLSTQNEVHDYISSQNISNKKILYFNTLANTPDRCLSHKQIECVLDWIEKQTEFHAFVYSNTPPLNHGKNFTVLPKKSFPFTMGLIKISDAVISPDTSIVHVGSTYQVPTLALFCNNSFDWFKKPMDQIWSPLAPKSIIVKEQCGTKFSSVSDISVTQLISSIEAFVKILKK